jgi:Nif-specific regulatory protein
VLDNIELLELPAQAQLLRLINERVFQRAGSSRALRVSARIIATTRVDLEPLARKGSFLPDLLQRLQTVLLPMAPLRSRPEDIRPLTDAAVRTYARCRKRDVIGVSGEALQQLEEHSWPGNVWELLTCVERAVLVSDDAILLPRHFLLSAAAATPSHSAVVAREEPNDTFVLRKLQDVEREYVLKVLKEAHNNHLRAAQLLGIPPSELEARLQSYGVIM